MHEKPLIRTLLLSGLFAGCLPAQLDKYRAQDQRLRPSPESASALTPRSSPAMAGEAKPVSYAPPVAAAPSIYAVDAQTFRITNHDGDVWDGLLTVLLRNYNLTIADRQAGILSTEWDSYYLANAVYRNKLSVRLVRFGSGAMELTLHNNVECLRDAAQAAGTLGAVWLPAPDPANEVSRIVQNLALVLGQPPPVLPPASALAKAVDQGPGVSPPATLNR